MKASFADESGNFNIIELEEDFYSFFDYGKRLISQFLLDHQLLPDDEGINQDYRRMPGYYTMMCRAFPLLKYERGKVGTVVVGVAIKSIPKPDPDIMDVNQCIQLNSRKE